MYEDALVRAQRDGRGMWPQGQVPEGPLMVVNQTNEKARGLSLQRPPALNTQVRAWLPTGV